jgi:hypothetical protein
MGYGRSGDQRSWKTCGRWKRENREADWCWSSSTNPGCAGKDLQLFEDVLAQEVLAGFRHVRACRSSNAWDIGSARRRSADPQHMREQHETAYPSPRIRGAPPAITRPMCISVTQQRPSPPVPASPTRGYKYAGSPTAHGRPRRSRHLVRIDARRLQPNSFFTRAAPPACGSAPTTHPSMSFAEIPASEIAEHGPTLFCSRSSRAIRTSPGELHREGFGPVASAR